MSHIALRRTSRYVVGEDHINRMEYMRKICSNEWPIINAKIVAGDLTDIFGTHGNTFDLLCQRRIAKLLNVDQTHHWRVVRTNGLGSCFQQQRFGIGIAYIIDHQLDQIWDIGSQIH
jgi:hypothetical protein